MSETFVSWGIEFPPEPLTSRGASLTQDFLGRNAHIYHADVVSWRCPFLRGAAIVGLRRKGILAGVSAVMPFIVDPDGVHVLNDYIGRMAERGSPLFEGLESAIVFYAALLPDGISSGTDRELVEPRSIEDLKEAGIDERTLIEIRTLDDKFLITACVLDAELVFGRLNLQVDRGSGAVLDVDLQMTTTESVSADMLL